MTDDDRNSSRGLRRPLAAATFALIRGVVRLAGTGVLLASIAASAHAQGWPATPPATGDADSRRWAAIEAPSPELRAGDRVSLVIPEAPPGVEELEVLLSVDGGRSYAVRVTPEIDRSVRCVDWRVPNLPAGEARLRIRYRLGGGEVEGPPSAAFTVHADPLRPQDLDVFHEGNWWGGLDADAAGGLPGLEARADRRIEAGSLDALAESHLPTACAAPPASLSRDASRPPRREPAPTRTENPREIFTPLRN
jgi:hypothetical protein